MGDISASLPIRPRQLIRDQVFATLAEEIISGRMQPLEEIRDQDLQAEYGVSRTPIREALNRLADLGLIEVSTNRFTRVAPVDLAAQAERVETAVALIGYCAVTAVPTYTDEQVASLQARIDGLLAAGLAGASTREGLGLWYALWGEIVLSAHNQTMIDILDGQLVLHLTRTVPAQPVAPELVDFMRTGLEQLRALLERRDGVGVREVIEPLFLRSTIEPLRAAAALAASASGDPTRIGRSPGE
ncbi:GntR family transcriptional regulator [Microbacterium sp. APC 3901]|uniref:GntR family transcriptional regulator n=1 Tax=Microbacterium sp. APC 3901 TaxID=3035192 RepID=UPI0025B434C4|nr:GntR family transcriptional regulator [Microbacterium sp. APC 3901]MDN3444341.1 GntR family transcriptional regulator [Microbacterium sp. APC 3901]